MLWLIRWMAPVCYPVGLVWLAMILSGIVAIRRKKHGLGVSLLGGALGATLLIQPWALGAWLARVEQPWKEFTLDQAPTADAVVVLGGGWRVSTHDYRTLDFTPACDRLFVGIELCRRKRAPVLLVGGDLPSQPTGYERDSEQIRRMLQDWGLTPPEFLSLGLVSNTQDEAARTRRLVDERGWKRVLLVTSAFHMERARRAFVAAGVPVHPVACDFQNLRVPPAPFPHGFRICPGTEDLATFTLFWHEMMGRLAYRLAGAG